MLLISIFLSGIISLAISIVLSYFIGLVIFAFSHKHEKNVLKPYNRFLKSSWNRNKYEWKMSNRKDKIKYTVVFILIIFMLGIL